MTQKLDRLFFVTTNEAKVNMLSAALSGLAVTIIHHNPRAVEQKGQKCRKWRELRSEDVQEVAGEKALAAFERVDQPVVVQCVALGIPFLKGFPGTNLDYVLRTIEPHRLIDLLGDDPYDFKCQFDLCLAYMDAELIEPRIFSSTVDGTLQKMSHGGNKKGSWLPLMEYFAPLGSIITLAEMDDIHWAKWWHEADDGAFPRYTTLFRRWLIETGRALSERGSALLRKHLEEQRKGGEE